MNNCLSVTTLYCIHQCGVLAKTTDGWAQRFNYSCCGTGVFLCDLA